MEIKNAKYIDCTSVGGQKTINITLPDDSIICVPMVSANTEYIEIMRQVDAGELTIEPADE